MTKPFFPTGGQLEAPTLILQLKSGDSLGVIDGAFDITYKKNLNSANELSFTVCKYIDGRLNPMWDSLTDLKSIYVPEFQERFEIKVSCHEEVQETKSITGTSLCEAELGQFILYGLEINTEDDIKYNSSDTYQTTVFYIDINDTDSEETKADKRNHSLLHRVLAEKAPFYRIGHVDESLKNLAFTFSADGTSIYDFLTGEVAKQMQCLFQFDSLERKIHAYVFSNDKPTESYGKDTTILIDRENLASSLTCEGDIDSLKNCFHVEGGDETINAALSLLNSSGGQYLYYFSPEMLAEMPENLSSAISGYNELSKDYLEKNPIYPYWTTHQYVRMPKSAEYYMQPSPFIPALPDTRFVSAFEKVVSEISNLTDSSGNKPYKDYNYTIPSDFTTHASLVAACHDALDLQAFLEISMMPDYKMEEYDKYQALSRLNESNFGTIGVAELNSSLKNEIKHIILQKAKTLINTALFSVNIDQSNFSTQSESGKITTATWKGTFSITDRQDPNPETNTITNSTYQEIAELEGITLTSYSIPASISLTINDDVVSYAQNSIAWMLAQKELPMASDLYAPEMKLKSFKKQIQFHGKSNLQIIQDVLTDCLGMISEQIKQIKNNPAILDTDPMYEKMEKYKQSYDEKLDAVSAALEQRSEQIKAVELFQLLMEAYLREVKEALDFKKYLFKYQSEHHLEQDLWEIFQYYRREGEYQNNNIISTNLKGNAEVVRYAQKLLEYASQELKTAGTIQYNISTTMDNLLALPEFTSALQQSQTAFDVGNWIRVRMDVHEETGEEQIYKLRLISYQINYEETNSSSIQVEFSTTTRGSGSAMSDVESILNSARSMATSYPAVVRQVALGNKTTEKVSQWVSEGLDLTEQQIINNSKEQTLVIDNNGLLARTYDTLTETYEDCQLRILNNGIYTTHDNWKTIDTALGKFQYKDPFHNLQPTEVYGIIARKLVGEQILGEDLKFTNSSGTMQFHDQGLTVSNGVNTIAICPNVSGNSSDRLFEIFSELIDANGFSSKKDLLYTDTSGNLNITGTITATNGSIGGFQINQSYLANGTNSLGAQNNSVYIGTDGISCGLGFMAYNTGECKMQGDITAKGELTLIGGFWSVDPRPFIPPVFTPDAISVTIAAGQKTYSGSTGLGTIGIATGLTIEDNVMAKALYTINDDRVNTYWDKTGFYLDCNNNHNGFQPILSFHDDGSCDIGKMPSDTLSFGNITINASLDNVIIKDKLSMPDSNIIQGNEENAYTNLRHILKYSYDSVIYNGTLQIFPSSNGSFRIGLYDATNKEWKGFLDFKPNNTISVGQNIQPISANELDLGSSSHFWHYTYSRVLHLKPGGYQTTGRINCPWKDGDTHDALTVADDGLTLYLGWEGSDKYSTNTILRGGSVHLKNASGAVVTSDERLKNSFKSMSEYEGFFDCLEPCFFKLNEGTSGRYHGGFKAQQVLSALEKNNLGSQDFAGYVTYTVNPDSEEYHGYEEECGLIYTEFTALNTHMIQKTRQELSEAKNTIQKLQQQLTETKDTIKKMQQELLESKDTNQKFQQELAELKNTLQELTT